MDKKEIIKLIREVEESGSIKRFKVNNKSSNEEIYNVLCFIESMIYDLEKCYRPKINIAIEKLGPNLMEYFRENEKSEGE